MNRNKDVCAGAYDQRGKPGFYCAGWLDAEYETFPFVTTKANGVVFPDWVPMGFTAIKRHVFSEISYPWFRPIYKEITVDKKQISVSVRDDIYFSLECRKKGLTIALDCDVNIIHHLEGAPKMEQKSVENFVKDIEGKTIQELESMAYKNIKAINGLRSNVEMLNNTVNIIESKITEKIKAEKESSAEQVEANVQAEAANKDTKEEKE